MTAKPVQHPWSPEALFAKALIYVNEMERYTPEHWQFGFWSSLSLEMLARAALAYVSPTLLASGKEWRNIYYALEYQTTAKAFKPSSKDTSEVLSILQELLPDFTSELFGSCMKQASRRNAELHSGEEAFEGLGTAEWLPKYYASCEVLLRSMGKSVEDFFSDPASVDTTIEAMRDTAAKAVAQDIRAHKMVWESKSHDDQTQLLERAVGWATRDRGHRVKCPACGSPAILRGSPQGTVKTEMGEDEVVQKQAMLPSSFECTACGLKIAGLSKLSACGLGDAFTATTTFSPAEYFNLHTDEELEEAHAASAEPEFEEDNNE